MFVKELITKPTLSFEVFPSSDKQTYSKVAAAVSKVACLQPSYMSVTFGKSSAQAAGLSQFLSHLTTVVPHITCKLTKKELDEVLQQRCNEGLKNILVLRGDDLPNSDVYNYFQHASDLIFYIKQNYPFCIGAACYPENHIEDKDIKSNINSCMLKQLNGADYLVTQMFFDNEIFYKYDELLSASGLRIPVIPAIMPITSYKTYQRCLNSFNVSIPDSLKNLIEKYKDNDNAIYQIGLNYAIIQIDDLIIHGYNNIHVYIMNSVRLAGDIMNAVSPLLQDEFV